VTTLDRMTQQWNESREENWKLLKRLRELEGVIRDVLKQLVDYEKNEDIHRVWTAEQRLMEALTGGEQQ
jgi:hypothetical protein